MIRGIISAVVVGVLAMAFWPNPARADTSDIVTYNFVGSAVCLTQGGCGVVAEGAFATVTGMFQFDQDQDSIIGGHFSFPNTPMVLIDFAGFTEATDSNGNDIDVFLLDLSNNTGMFLVFTDPSDSTLETGIVFLNGGSSVVNVSFLDHGTFIFTSAAVTLQSANATPEPSSLLLVGTGLLGLGPFIRRRLART